MEMVTEARVVCSLRESAPTLGDMIEKYTRIGSQQKSKIRTAAVEVFGRYGFKGGTIDQIAEICGISKPNILYYFENKDALYWDAAKHVFEIFFDKDPKLDPKKEPLPELERFCDETADRIVNSASCASIFSMHILQEISLGQVSFS